MVNRKGFASLTRLPKTKLPDVKENLRGTELPFCHRRVLAALHWAHAALRDGDPVGPTLALAVIGQSVGTPPPH